MILDINKIEEKALANFKGGEKALNARMHVDENNKIIFGRLEPGASIGEHTHETNSEIIFFTSGKGKVIYDGKETNEYSWSKGHFYFIDKPCEKRNPGYPLDSISIMPECNKYFVDLTEEDKNKNQKDYNEDDVIEFIVKNLKKL